MNRLRGAGWREAWEAWGVGAQAWELRLTSSTFRAGESSLLERMYYLQQNQCVADVLVACPQTCTW